MTSRLRRIRKVPSLARREKAAHKGDFGRVLVIGGSEGMIGAPALAANAALRSGAGLVRIACEESIVNAVLMLAPCATAVAHLNFGPLMQVMERSGKRSGRRRAMTMEFSDATWDALAPSLDEFCEVIVIGPGWSVDAARISLLRRLLSGAVQPIVIDADGLNALSQIDDWCGLIRGRSKRSGGVVLTPHPGEMKRIMLSAGITGDPVKNREKSAVALAKACKAVVVLKGAGTIVTNGADLYVNSTGNPGMATGGSGDVLSGVTAALIGQHMSPLDAAVLAVNVHGTAGDLAANTYGQVSMIASDLLDYLPHAFKKQLRRKT